MFFLSAFIFCLNLSAVDGQSYLSKCVIFPATSLFCTEYFYNDINCFPWNVNLCQLEMRYDGTCSEVFCEVLIKTLKSDITKN